MKKILLLLLVLFLFAGCGPSEAEIQKAIMETQTSASRTEPTETPYNILIKPTDPSILTKAPTRRPSPTYRPTKTFSSPLPTKTPNAEILIQTVIDGLSEAILKYTDTKVINTFRRGTMSLEIEVKTKWASKDSQPDVSYEIIKVLSDVFGQSTEAKALNFVKGNPDHFSILLTTYSTDGDYKYQSLTYYDTLVKLYKKQINYDEWVQETNAGFIN